MLKRIKNLFKINRKEERITVEQKIEDLFESLNEDTMLIEIGSDLVPFGVLICDIISELRNEVQSECGFILPAIRVRDNVFIQENELIISVRSKVKENLFMVPNEQSIREELYDILKSIVYDSIDSIFTNEIAEKYINTVQRNNSWLVWNMTNVISVIDIKTILSDIILKGKSIKNIDYVFEKIGEQIFSDNNYRDCLKKYNPHVIAKQVVKSL